MDSDAQSLHAAALVTCWSVITPETGATMSTMPLRLVGIVAQQPEMFRCSFHVDLGLFFRVLRDLQIVQRDGAVLVEVLGALQLRACQDFIRDRLPVVGEAARDIVAANSQQQLALLHRVAEPRVNGHHAAGRQRNHRHVAGDVGRDRAGDHEFGIRGTRDAPLRAEIVPDDPQKNRWVPQRPRPSPRAVPRQTDRVPAASPPGPARAGNKSVKTRTDA